MSVRFTPGVASSYVLVKTAELLETVHAQTSSSSGRSGTWLVGAGGRRWLVQKSGHGGFFLPNLLGQVKATV